MAALEPTSTPASAPESSLETPPFTNTTFPLPTILTYPASAPPRLIAQGAEARLYKTTYLLPTLPCAFKFRPAKPWRHPTLDQRLTRQRILAEARVLVKCRREGVPVPAVYGLDENVGWMAMEWIEGEPVRVMLNRWLLRAKTVAVAGGDEEAKSAETNPKLIHLMRRVGQVVGQLHKVGVVHGDLTTSNLMLRPEKGKTAANVDADDDSILDGEIVVIDFGLASQANQDEERAVDLYVLERAFASTHPRAECLFDELLQGYRSAFKQAPTVLKRLEEVRMRGRKRSMLG